MGVPGEGGGGDVHHVEGWGRVRCVVVLKDGGRCVGVEMCAERRGRVCECEGGRDEDCNTESRLKFQVAIFSHMGSIQHHV